MARTICIANQKGGVGKTTTSVNLAAALAELGRQVLIVDMDPQGNASSGLGIKRYENQESNIYQVLIGEKPIRETIQTTQVQGLNIIPANPDLVGAEIELVDMPQREYRLKSALSEFQDKYHYIFIDCPPSLGLLTVNSLSAAETFLVPLQCEYYALEGLSQLLNTAGLIKKSLNPALRIEGICLTMFDARNNLSHQVVAEIQSHFGDKVFQAIIPRNVRLSEAPSHCQTIFQYDPKSLGAKKYKELAVELDQRVYGVRPETSAQAVETEIHSDGASDGEVEMEQPPVATVPHLEIVPNVEEAPAHSTEVEANV
jgi:chromosome partitioning protein